MTISTKEIVDWLDTQIKAYTDCIDPPAEKTISFVLAIRARLLAAEEMAKALTTVQDYCDQQNNNFEAVDKALTAFREATQ